MLLLRSYALASNPWDNAKYLLQEICEFRFRQTVWFKILQHVEAQKNCAVDCRILHTTENEMDWINRGITGHSIFEAVADRPSRCYVPAKVQGPVLVTERLTLSNLRSAGAAYNLLEEKRGAPARIAGKKMCGKK